MTHQILVTLKQPCCNCLDLETRGSDSVEGVLETYEAFASYHIRMRLSPATSPERDGPPNPTVVDTLQEQQAEALLLHQPANKVLPSEQLQEILNSLDLLVQNYKYWRSFNSSWRGWATP